MHYWIMFYFLVIGYFILIGDWKMYFLVMEILEWYSLAITIWTPNTLPNIIYKYCIKYKMVTQIESNPWHLVERPLYKVFCDFSKHKINVKVKTIGLLHNYIILANCLIHLIYVQCQVVKWVTVYTKWPPFMVQYGQIISFCNLAKRLKKCQGQNNRSCAQLHHPSYLLKTWSKVNVKQLNMVSTKWPHLWYNVGKF